MTSNFFKLVIACVVVLAAFIGHSIWYATLAAKSANVASLQNQIDAKSETMSRIASARAALTEISGAEVSLQNYFVPETNMVAFIDGLQTEGNAQGVALNVLSVSAGTGDQPMFILALTIKGTFDAVMRTVGVIEYTPYYVSTSGLSLVKNDKDNWQADLKLLVGSIAVAASTPLTP